MMIPSMVSMRLNKFKKLKGTNSVNFDKETESLSADSAASPDKILSADSVSKKIKSTPKKETFETMGVKDRLNSVMPIRTSKEGFQGTKSLDDVSLDSLKSDKKKTDSKNDELQKKLEALKKLRRGN